jgi:hypothetical protein
MQRKKRRPADIGLSERFLFFVETVVLPPLRPFPSENICLRRIVHSESKNACTPNVLTFNVLTFIR